MRAAGLRTKRYPSGGRAARVVLCVLLSAAICLLALAARRHLRLPAFSLRLPAAGDAGGARGAGDAGEAMRAQRDLTLTGYAWYALQLGAFTGVEAASQQAAEYIPRGAAGLVRFDEGAYRVYAAAYGTRAQAQGVQTRLSAQGVSTYIRVLERPALTLRAGGEARQVAAAEEVLGYLLALEDKLFSLSTALDARQTDALQAQAALLSESETCAQMERALREAFGGTVEAVLRPLQGVLLDVAEAAKAAEGAAGAARTGAAIKRCHLCVITGLRDFAAGLAPEGA